MCGCVCILFLLWVIIVPYDIQEVLLGYFIYSVLLWMVLVVKNLPDNAGDTSDAYLIPGSGRSSEEGMAIHSSVLAWRIPWT